MIASLACATLAALAATEGEPLARVSTVQVARGETISDAAIVDVDRDGEADLVVASAAGARRRVAVHLRREGTPAFVSAPDRAVDLPDDVVAFACADVDAPPGREIVLLSASGAYAWRPEASEQEGRFARLVACDLLWQAVAAGDAFDWQEGVVDLDGDGLDDLVLPRPGAWRVALQRRGEAGAPGGAAPRFDEGFDLPVPDDLPGAGGGELFDADRVEVRRPGGGQAVRVRFGGGGITFAATDRARAPLLRVAEGTLAPRAHDWDGDGDLDLLALGAREMIVFVQEPRGRFDAARAVRLASPVVRERSRELDVSFGARSLDLDLDRRADCVFFAGDRRAKEPRTQALVYLNARRAPGQGAPPELPLFGAEGAPEQLLVIAGFARPLRFADVDGDGSQDLAAVSVQPDLIDELRSAASERIDAELYVWKNLGRGFSRKPDLVRRISIPASDSEYTADFVGDATGDGTADLLLREGRDRLALYATRRSRDGLSVDERAAWEIAIAPEAVLLLPSRLGPGNGDLFVVEEGEVLCASFR